MTDTAITRRALLGAATMASAGLLAGAVGASVSLPTRGAVAPALMNRAMAALARHRSRITARDLIAIADFDAPSSQPRLHLVDTIGGRTTSFLVSHGRGSDPAHTGWLERFSNQDGSNASSAGAYLTGDTYMGKHGRSRRLIGLDATNSAAEARGIVIHSAWYVSPEVARQHGKIGRSEGCLAVSEAELGQVLARLSPGHMVYADKL